MQNSTKETKIITICGFKVPAIKMELINTALLNKEYETESEKVAFTDGWVSALFSLEKRIK